MMNIPGSKFVPPFPFDNKDALMKALEEYEKRGGQGGLFMPMNNAKFVSPFEPQG